MCGEKKVMRGAKDKRMGSPPHVRGKAGRRTSCTGIQRITPACAGKSFEMKILKRRLWDHPRMCGEKTKKIP